MPSLIVMWGSLWPELEVSVWALMQAIRGSRSAWEYGAAENKVWDMYSALFCRVVFAGLFGRHRVLYD